MKYRYPFTNSIVFALVMQNPELCKGLLERIFPDREIETIEIHESNLQVEKYMAVAPDAKKIRMDVMFKDSRTIYDIEMQVRHDWNLSKRIRYIHSIMDIEELKSGDEYSRLKPSYVIFICCHDPFDMDQAVYEFQAYDTKNELPLEDESYTIVLNSCAPEENTLDSLKPLFNYINEEVVTAGDSFIEKLDSSVGNWNTGEGVRHMLTFEHDMSIRERKAEERGIAIGENKGRIEMIKTMASNNMKPERIAKVTNISLEEINRILEC